MEDSQFDFINERRKNMPQHIKDRVKNRFDTIEREWEAEIRKNLHALRLYHAEGMAAIESTLPSCKEFVLANKDRDFDEVEAEQMQIINQLYINKPK